jgi:hypothetical protein
MPAPPGDKAATPTLDNKEASKGRCPFGFDQTPKPSTVAATTTKKEQSRIKDEVEPNNSGEKQTQQVTFIAPDTASETAREAQPQPEKANEQSRMVFTGPVFIGYSAEDAAKILRGSGLGRAWER